MTVSVELYEHQKVGVSKVLAQSDQYGGCGIFAEMGCGKTLVAISAMGHLHQRGACARVLIVCPKTLKRVWADELLRSLIPWQTFVLDGPVDARAEKVLQVSQMRGPLIVITNYDSMVKLEVSLKQFKPDLVIADESQSIKSHKAHRTKALKAVPSRYRWAITGTPVINNPLDLWSQVDWFKPGLLYNSYYAYRARYANVYQGAGYPMIKGWKHLDELESKVSKHSWRVTKDECLDLPEKLYVVRRVEMTEPERRVYKDMAEEMIAEVDGLGEPIVATTALVKLLRLQQITSGFVGWGKDGEVKDFENSSKMEALSDLMEELTGQKVVIWCRFKHDIQRIRQSITKTRYEDGQVRGWTVHTLDGDTPDAKRGEIVKQFQEDGKPQVIVGHPVVGGVGITLTAASHCVYYSNTWGMGERMQSEDRLHRIGQKSHVTYYDLVCEKTIDTYILKVLQKKEALADRLTGDDMRRIVGGV